MTSEGLGEMFEGDSADTRAGKFPLVSMGGRAEGLACADPGARTPIGSSGIFHMCLLFPLSFSCFLYWQLHNATENNFNAIISINSFQNCLQFCLIFAWSCLPKLVMFT